MPEMMCKVDITDLLTPLAQKLMPIEWNATRADEIGLRMRQLYDAMEVTKSDVLLANLGLLWELLEPAYRDLWLIISTEGRWGSCLNCGNTGCPGGEIARQAVRNGDLDPATPPPENPSCELYEPVVN